VREDESAVACLHSAYQLIDLGVGRRHPGMRCQPCKASLGDRGRPRGAVTRDGNQPTALQRTSDDPPLVALLVAAYWATVLNPPEHLNLLLVQPRRVPSHVPPHDAEHNDAWRVSTGTLARTGATTPRAGTRGPGETM